MKDQLEVNHQSVYYCQQNSVVVALNIIAFGIKEFRRTYLFQNLDDLDTICKRIQTRTSPSIEDFQLTSGFIVNHLIDCIRISICFENFFKAFLLIGGNIIHNLDRNIYPVLFKEQRKRPIHLSEVKSINNWTINPKIECEPESLKNQIKGITKNTLSISTLQKDGYKAKYGITNDFLEVCKPYFEYRNNLHYYIGDSFSVTETTKTKFDRIIKFVRINMAPRHDQLIDVLKKGDEYKIGDIL